MVATCCVCGIERKDESRTFHKFPKSEDLKKKWMEALNFKSIYKNAVVCSDHFTKNDYRSLCAKPLLNKDAVPVKKSNNPSSNSTKDSHVLIDKNVNIEKDSLSNNVIIKKSSQVQCCEIQCGQENQVDNISIPDNQSSREINNTKGLNTCSIERDESILNLDDYLFNSINDCSMDIEQEDSNSENASSIILPRDANTIVRNSAFSKKRKTDLQDENYNKKQRVSLSEYGIIRKADFNSEDAWNRVVKFMYHTKDVIKTLMRQNNKLESKVSTLQDLIATLKNEKLLSNGAADAMEVGSN